MSKTYEANETDYVDTSVEANEGYVNPVAPTSGAPTPPAYTPDQLAASIAVAEQPAESEDSEK